MGEHARYSPSAATRWLTCPGSIGLSESLKQVQGSSPQAEEGTAAHWLFESFDTRRYAYQAPNGVVLTDELVDTVRMSLAEMSRHISGKEFREIRLPTWEVLGLDTPDVWGTADVVALGDDRVWLVDFKYGKYPVSPENNHQLLTYAVGLLDLVGDAYEDFTLAILQPRSNHLWQQWDITLDDITNWAEKLRAYFAERPNHFQRGEHCFFCPAKNICGHRLFENETKERRTEFCESA